MRAAAILTGSVVYVLTLAISAYVRSETAAFAKTAQHLERALSFGERLRIVVLLNHWHGWLMWLAIGSFAAGVYFIAKRSDRGPRAREIFARLGFAGAAYLAVASILLFCVDAAAERADLGRAVRELSGRKGEPSLATLASDAAWLWLPLLCIAIVFPITRALFSRARR